MSDEDYAGEARAMDGIEEEHQGDADIARYERSNKEEIDHDRTTTNQARD